MSYCPNIGVWIRIEGQTDFQKIGDVFQGLKIVGRYGWIDVNDGSFCFDPARYVYVCHRTGDGAYHSGGWFP